VDDLTNLILTRRAVKRAFYGPARGSLVGSNYASAMSIDLTRELIIKSSTQLPTVRWPAVVSSPRGVL